MIIKNNEEALKVDCENVLSEEIGSIIDQLEIELKKSENEGFPGIGLAAPQINVAKNAAIIRLDKFKINLINAKIEKSYDKAVFEGEGCLSFPGRFEKTNRFQEIYVLNDIEPYRFTATGLLAVVIQHELDHTNKILLPDVAIKEVSQKVRPNDECVCGSKRKFKKCCMNKV